VALKDELRNVEKELRDLARTSKDLTKADKEALEVRRNELEVRKEGLQESIQARQETTAARQAISGAVAPVASAAVRGLADPLMTSQELQAQVGRATGQAIGGISVAGFQLGPELGGLLGEQAGDVARAVLPPGAGAAITGVTQAIQGQADALRATGRRRFAEGRGRQIGAFFGEMAAAGFEISDEQLQASIEAGTRASARSLKVQERAAFFQSRANDKYGMAGKD